MGTSQPSIVHAW